MKILVLGSGAGGGFPQWNCNCRLCGAQRAGELPATPRTQSSIAVSVDGAKWVLLNASPDLGHQLRSQPLMQPRHGLREAPIAAVVLMDAQIDHVAGLLSLREGPPIEMFATPCVFDDLVNGLPLLSVLQHYCSVHWHMLPVAGEQTSAEFEMPGFASLKFTAIAIPGKAPPYSPHRQEQVVGDNIALLIEDRHDGSSLFYAPGLAEVGEHELGWMRRADCLMVDGTFWDEDEMQRAGLSHKPAREMGHLPQNRYGQRAGMVDMLAQTTARRKVLIHINNSNPILDAGSEQRRHLDAHGIEVAYDGMEITL